MGLLCAALECSSRLDRAACTGHPCCMHVYILLFLTDHMHAAVCCIRGFSWCS